MIMDGNLATKTVVIDEAFDTAPAVRIVNDLLRLAIVKRASDIHGDPLSNALRISMRVDGVLDQVVLLPADISSNIIARIKILSRLDTTERRLPQDGKFSVETDNGIIDVRVATFPTIFGERFVLRILDRFTQLVTLEESGMSANMITQLRQLLQSDHGFFLVTGPTGVGKTTTLYALLKELQQQGKTIVTLEDPVEYTLEGISQGQINPEIGFTFARGLKSLVRHDPDVIFVGEIRDEETARIAIQASLTGHIVLSTLHTGDAVSAVARLMDMGIEPFLINASLTGVLAQRLVKRLCGDCKKQEVVDPSSVLHLNKKIPSTTATWSAIGCESCEQRGFKGRIGLFELCVPSNEFKKLLSQKHDVSELLQQTCRDGMQLLIHDAAYKVDKGLISFDELVRLSA
jgi:type II secretory ATPase GspE/PulE/Tfp pilus assembly ATPase PilB-like protein